MCACVCVCVCRRGDLIRFAFPADHYAHIEENGLQGRKDERVCLLAGYYNNPDRIYGPDGNRRRPISGLFKD